MMSRHTTSDEVLKMIVGMKLEIGVSMFKIRDLIDKFCPGRRQEESEEIAGFLSVEDVPQRLRDQFIVALSALAGPPGYRHDPAGARALSASEIWG